MTDEQQLIEDSCLCTDGLCSGCSDLLDALAASRARVRKLRAALVRPAPEEVATELGYECLICGWEVDPISPDSHEPSCILADEALAADAALSGSEADED